MAQVRKTENARAKLLVVDDDAAIRKLLVETLRRGNYEVLEAANGREAQAVLQAREVDLAITDLEMPELDGLKLMRWAMQKCPGVTWMILSGQATFDDAVIALRLGAYDLITKPLATLDSLMVAVRNALRQRQLEREQERLRRDIERRNVQLTAHVRQLRHACQVMCEQARMIGEDLRRAERIQRALLPQTPPRIENFSIHAVYLPSRNVGGDLYDVMQVDERHFYACIADAAGHGVSAAMLAVLFKNRLHLRDDQTNRPVQPDEALREVNRAIFEECRAPSLFVTAACCLVDTQTGTATIASAGHPPLLLCRANGRHETIHRTGPALGLSPDAKYRCVRVRLGAGDRLLMYTDGISDSGEMGGVTGDRMAAMLCRPSERDGQALLHAILETAQDVQSPAGQEDDITMLLVTSEESPSLLENTVSSPRSSAVSPAPGDKTGAFVAMDDRQTFILIRGRGTWTESVPVHEISLAAVQANRDLTFDLSQCEYLDSTFLGTVQQLVDDSLAQDVQLRIQGIRPAVRRLFEELGMERVIRRISSETLPLPEPILPLSQLAADDVRDSQRLLEAHEALAALNDRNREEFRNLIDGIRAEVSRCEHARG
ncbi:MAG TPA: hypothetical protein DCX07_08325 [Phycisphaerales bacterium]|nr:hypothetical protein [Phycisphaerales bacterium]